MDGSEKDNEQMRRGERLKAADRERSAAFQKDAQRLGYFTECGTWKDDESKILFFSVS